MNYLKKTLKNNLRIVLVPMPSLESAIVTLWVKIGSRFEKEKEAGLSHFLEHMVFKGSRKRPSAEAISKEVDSIGAEINAGTSKEWTNFHIRSRASVIEKSFDILSDIVLEPLLLEKEIKKEKGVILEEIAMYEDTPLIKIYDIFDAAVYAGSTLARDVAGTKETVSGLKREDFIRYRKRYYYPENMLLTVVGNFKEKTILALAEKYFLSLKKTGQKPVLVKEILKQEKPNLILKEKKTDQAHLIVGFKGKPFGWPGRFAEAVLATVLGGGMSSRMFLEVREKRGLAYSVKTATDYAFDNGSLFTYAGVHIGKIKEATQVILDQYFGLKERRFKITASELKKTKEYLKGHLALSFEDTQDVSSFFALEELYLGAPKTPAEVFKAIDGVKLEDVYQVADEIFNPRRLNFAVIGPYNFKELDLLKLVNF